MALNYPPYLGERIRQLMNEILSDRYDCKVNLIPKQKNTEKEEKSA